MCQTGALCRTMLPAGREGQQLGTGDFVTCRKKIVGMAGKKRKRSVIV